MMPHASHSLLALWLKELVVCRLMCTFVAWSAWRKHVRPCTFCIDSVPCSLISSQRTVGRWWRSLRKSPRFGVFQEGKDLWSGWYVGNATSKHSPIWCVWCSRYLADTCKDDTHYCNLLVVFPTAIGTRPLSLHALTITGSP
jgi:hypothetical protein